MSSADQKETKPKLSKESIKKSLRIFKYIQPYLGYFIAAMFFLVAGSLIFMALMGLPGEMANTAIGKPKFNLNLDVKDYGWIFLIVLIFQGILSYFRTYYFAIISFI